MDYESIKERSGTAGTAGNFFQGVDGVVPGACDISVLCGGLYRYIHDTQHCTLSAMGFFGGCGLFCMDYALSVWDSVLFTEIQ